MSLREWNRPFSFDEVATSYDDWYRDPMGRVYDRLEKGAVGQFLPSPEAGSRLLEVGCGTGHWTRFFAEKGFQVTGIDISREMMKIALGKSIPEAGFLLGDVLSLPFVDDAFDAAAAITTLEFVVDQEQAMRELVRCVRPGGRIVVGVLNRLSWLGLARKRNGSPLFKRARFLSRWELVNLLSPYGATQVRAVALIIPKRWGLWMAPMVDFLARLSRLPWGDFLVGEVQL